MEFKAVGFDIDGTFYPKRIMIRNLILSSLPNPFFAISYFKMRKRIRALQKNENYNTSLDLISKEALILSGKENTLLAPDIDKETLKSVSKKKAELEKKIYKKYAKQFLNIKPYKEVKEVFDFLNEKKIPIAIFSDFPVENKLKALGIDDKINYVFSSKDAGFLKPDIRCFEYLYENSPLSKFKKSEVLYIGDSYSKDCVGAFNFGFSSILLSKKHKEFPKAYKVYKNWRDFSLWLKTILEEKNE